MTTPKGVRMVNENIVQEKRAFIITDREEARHNWDKIPNGTLYINPVTGIAEVKVEGETDFIPIFPISPNQTGEVLDGENDVNWKTLVIARDTCLEVETFTVKTTDNGNGTFTYFNSRGEQRTMPFDDEGYTFEIENGSYIPRRNHLRVTLDDVLERSVSSGGIKEIDSTRFKVLEKIPVGTEVTATYIQWVRIGNPFPRVFECADEPQHAQVGDIWIDMRDDESVDENFDASLLELYLGRARIKWSQLTGVPSTLLEHNIQDAALKDHRHYANEIVGLLPGQSKTGFENAVRAVQDYNAETLKNKDIDLSQRGGAGAANRIPVYDANGKLPVDALPATGIFKYGMIIDWYGKQSEVPDGWAICDGSNGTPDLRGKFIKAANGESDGIPMIDTKARGGSTSYKGQFTVAPKNLPRHRHAPGTLNIIGEFSGAGSSSNSNTNERPKYTGAFYKKTTGTNGVPVDFDGGKGDYVRFDPQRQGAWSGATDYQYGNSSGAADPITVTVTGEPEFVALYKIMYIRR